MANPYGGLKKGWYKGTEVPFSWREWGAIHKSSRGVHRQKDRRKDLSFQKKGDFVNKTIGTRMNFLMRGLADNDRDQIARVQCYVMRKERGYAKEKTLKGKRVTWKYQQPKGTKTASLGGGTKVVWTGIQDDSD